MSSPRIPPIAHASAGPAPDEPVTAQVIKDPAPAAEPIVDAQLSEAQDDLIDASIASPPVAKPELASERKKRKPATVAEVDPTTVALGRVLYGVDCLAVVWEVVFGTISLMVILAVLATIPVLNLLSLGYLLESSGRVARTGKLRKGFIGISKAYRVGAFIAGTWICLLPLRFLSGVWCVAVCRVPPPPRALCTRRCQR